MCHILPTEANFEPGIASSDSPNFSPRDPALGELELRRRTSDVIYVIYVIYAARQTKTPSAKRFSPFFSPSLRLRDWTRRSRSSTLKGSAGTLQTQDLRARGSRPPNSELRHQRRGGAPRRHRSACDQVVRFTKSTDLLSCQLTTIVNHCHSIRHSLPCHRGGTL